jgi:hypothetical protein
MLLYLEAGITRRRQCAPQNYNYEANFGPAKVHKNACMSTSAYQANKATAAVGSATSAVAGKAGVDDPGKVLLFCSTHGGNRICKNHQVLLMYLSLDLVTYYPRPAALSV